MKKALLWSVIPLRNECTRDQMLLENRIGSNSGNLLFHTSMARTLTLNRDNVPDACFTSVKGDIDAFASRANERYRAFVMPLANAFRANYISKLRVLTNLVRRMTIPCVVTGVGIQANDWDELKASHPFDGDVRAFVNAVLDHSAMLGVRGEATAAYLRRLGYIEEKHFTIIGCPSMFTFGANLPRVEAPRLDANARVCFNGKQDSCDAIRSFTEKACALFPRRTYVAQNIDELWMLRSGMPLLPVALRRAPKYLPCTRLHPLVRSGCAVGYLDAGTWIDAMHGMDFSFGCNIHGNVAALLAGTPAVVLEKDLRVWEIARVHAIPTVTMEDMRAGADPMEVFANLDYTSFNEGHEARWRHFDAFLARNGLEHIDAGNPSTPYDDAIRKAPGVVAPPVRQTAGERRAAFDMTVQAIERYRARVSGKLRASVPSFAGSAT